MNNFAEFSITLFQRQKLSPAALRDDGLQERVDLLWLGSYTKIVFGNLFIILLGRGRGVASIRTAWSWFSLAWITATAYLLFKNE